MNSEEKETPTVESAATKPKKKKTTKKKKKATTTKKEEVAGPEWQGYFTKHETPDARWFKSQLNSGETTRLEVVEFFHLYSTLTTDNERILLLRNAKNDRVIMTLLNMNYSPSMYDLFVPNQDEVKKCRDSTLPWGVVPYTLRKQYRRLLYLFNSNADGAKLDNTAKGKIYYEFMESLHKSEAHILNECITQTLNVPGLNPKIVKKAFGNARFPDIKI